jgi:hypothetical protein
MVGRTLLTIRTQQCDLVQGQVVEGPRGTRSSRGVATGAILLRDNHVTALLPLAGAPSEEGWGPLRTQEEDAKGPFAEVVRRLASCGALLPTVATLEPEVVIERLDDPELPRLFGPTDLLQCPYCKVEKRRGT